jgi:hypothetical protein
MTQSEAFEYLKSHFAEFPPSTSVFSPDLGPNGVLDVGDYIGIEQLDPIAGLVTVKNVGVYVSEMSNDSFTFVTAKGHPEAGAIRFSVDDQDGDLVVRIESEASSGSVGDFLAYITFGKVLQSDVWGNFLLHARGVCSTTQSTYSAQLTATAYAQPLNWIAPTRTQLMALQVAP